MKTIVSCGLGLSCLLLTAGVNRAQSVSEEYPDVIKSNSVTVIFTTQGELPESVAILVQTNDAMDDWQAKQQAAMDKWRAEVATNRNARPAIIPPPPTDHGTDTPHWQPFKSKLLVELGQGAGKRTLMFAYKYKGKPFDGSWRGSGVMVQSLPPNIGFNSPQERVTSKPLIQLQGYVSTDLGKPLTYQIFDQKGEMAASGEGYVNDRYFDRSAFEFTTNYFTCYDLELRPGTNTIVVRGEDTAGYSFTTNFVIVFTTEGDTNPPVFSIASPANGEVIAGDSVTIRGPSDDPTARFVGEISANGHTNNLSALVERNGYFWFEHLPLAPGPNQVTIVATDVAGNSSRTNFVIYGSDKVRITMDPVSKPDQLWQPKIDVVTGTVRPANHAVWVNGVQATVKPDGTWLAKNVPVQSSPAGGTALFNLTAISPGDMTKGNVRLTDHITSQASLGTNIMVLNSSTPACGVFQIHLTGTAGRTFVLEASTNLVEWVPLLTNSCPDSSYDYTDTNASHFPCRFFRVVPTQ